MKLPSLDELVSLCICLLTAACNREMQHLFFYWLFVVGEKKDFGFGSGSKFNCATRGGSDHLRYGVPV